MSSVQPWTRTAGWLLAGSAAALVALAAWVIPWQAVPGAPLDPVSARSVFSSEELARSDHVAAWSRVWSWSGLALSLVTAGVLGFSSVGRRLVARLPGPWWVQASLAVLLCRMIGRIVTVGPDAALQQLRLDWGLSTQPWLAWARDVAVSEVLGTGVTVLGVLGLLGLIRRFPRRWPALAALAGAALVSLGSFGYPLVVEPLFNDFTSLPAGPLRDDLEAMARDHGVALGDVLIADASRRTTTLNAYVSGFGSSRRLVLYDTLLDELTPEQTMTVAAHELSHAHHDDVAIATALGALGLGVGVGLLGLILSRRRTPVTPGSVPLILALVAVGSLLAAPVPNGISRHVETRADVDSLRWTGAYDTFIEMQRELALTSYADPTPPSLSAWWFSTHPGVLTRIAIAHRLSEESGRGESRRAGTLPTGTGDPPSAQR